MSHDPDQRITRRTRRSSRGASRRHFGETSSSAVSHARPAPSPSRPVWLAEGDTGSAQRVEVTHQLVPFPADDELREDLSGEWSKDHSPHAVTSSNVDAW